MTERLDADCAIVGAGCAGLSLAVHLIEQGPPGLRVVLLEPRTRYTRDRTWCFWDVAPHPFAQSVTHRWPRWRVRTAGGEHEAGPGRYRYQHVPADAFYRQALARIDAADGVTLRRGVRVTEIEDRGPFVRLATSEGELRAAVAFDSRPPRFDAPAAPGEVRLLQHFRGWRVRLERPTFDPDVCTLMDFDVDQGDGIHFVYVLPFDAHTALIEDTWFTEAPFERARYEGNLRRYLGERLGADAWEVLDEEGGVLPMTTEPMPGADPPRVHRIGLAGGLAKPSTGYAFVFIQRQAAVLARRMRDGLPPRPVPAHGAWARSLDRVFLQVLHEHPARAPALFLRLFRDAPDEAVVRFLSEASSLADDLRIMASLPAAPFTAATWRARRLLLRK